MAYRRRKRLKLDIDELRQLEVMEKSRNGAASKVKRAKIIPMYGSGKSIAQICR